MIHEILSKKFGLSYSNTFEATQEQTYAGQFTYQAF